MREYREELDGFRVGEIVIFNTETSTRWKIEKLWVSTWCDREVRLCALICTDLGPNAPRFQRKIGTRKEQLAVSWLRKVPHDQTAK